MGKLSTLLHSIAFCVGGLASQAAMAQSGMKVIPVSEDTYVNSNTADDGRNANYGSSTQLRFRYSQNSASSVYNLITYLKFSLKGLGLPAGTIIDSATMQGTVYYSQTGAGHMWHVLPVANNTWTETTVTWNNKPGIGPDTLSVVAKPADAIGDSTPYTALWRGLSSRVQSALKADSLVSFAIYTRLNSSANTSMYSREWTVPMQRPQLTIYYHQDTSVVVPPPARQVETRKHNLNIIYFLPTDVDTVAGYRQRLNGIMLQTQDFYRKWMNYYGYTNETFGLRKDSDGLVKISILHGLYDRTHYPYDGGGTQIIPEVNAFFAANPGEKNSTHTLVILPQDDYNPFYGLGNGWCFALDNPNIDTSYFATGGTSAYIGGLVHELGHGLNLPHDKEKVSEKNDPAKGTALMGSGNQTYGRAPTFMTAGECAILHTCEVFRTEDAITDLYGGGNASFTNFHSNYSNGNINLSGKFTTTKAISSIVIYNDQDDDGANYDQLAWVGTLVGSDSFNVSMPVAEFWKKYSTYTLRIKFVFANGSSKDITYPYRFDNNIPVIDINFGPGNRPDGITPVADTYIRNGSYANTNYGNDSSLSVKPDPNSGYKRETFLKFRLSDYAGNLAHVDTVRLSLKVRGVNTNGGKTNLVVKWAAKTNWDNSDANSLTWNKWTADGTYIDSLNAGFYYGGNWMTWNISKDTLLKRIRSGDSLLVFHVYGVFTGTDASTSDITFFANESALAGDRPSLSLLENSALQPLSAPASMNKQSAAMYSMKLADGLQVYPNPVASTLNVNAAAGGSALISNSNGVYVRRVMLTKGNGNSIGVGDLPAGTYYLQPEKGNYAPVKFIIAR
ncbi:putative secreted protein (Por secretion system target) [Chitinophaga dinghuensis]|uniref:Putative secreted protein (Por secretion system target) n=1 Tax=Chitinophaga dinghuensis TaxID=1539050 RepID=A0A327WCF4_9BACT|nr:DNRLRE domain-containing protein [Chitinophaga dinghuensis]RAJ87889.1 putative secreted protein (Por secretion system target) [Chitinophaga dinghuensis]